MRSPARIQYKSGQRARNGRHRPLRRSDGVYPLNTLDLQPEVVTPRLILQLKKGRGQRAPLLSVSGVPAETINTQPYCTDW